MEGGFSFPFGGDPEDLMRGLREFAEQQAESVAEAHREQFATLTLNTAVELTAAALSRVEVKGGADEQALALRDAMRVLFPEAVALVSAARQGFMRESQYEPYPFVASRRKLTGIRGSILAAPGSPVAGGSSASSVTSSGAPNATAISPSRHSPGVK